MYAIITMFGVVVANMHCPHFTFEQCEETLAEMAANSPDASELQAYNYCSETPVPTSKLSEDQQKQLEDWVARHNK